MLHEYKATVIRVVDGDTIDLNIDLGFRLWTVQRVRLMGCNCPEINSRETRFSGIAAADETRKWLARDAGVTVVTSKSDSFGRWLADVYRAGDLVSLSSHLLQTGHATLYRGNKGPIQNDRFMLESSGIFLPASKENPQ